MDRESRRFPSQQDFALTTPPNSQRLRVHEAISLFWKYHFRFVKSEKKYRFIAGEIIRSFGNKFMDEVSGYDVKLHKENRLKRVGLGAVFHDHTLIHLIFSKFYEWKRDQFKVDGLEFSLIKLPPHNPTDGIPKRKPPPRMTYLTQDEYARLMEHATDRLKEYIRFELHSCLRPGEAFVLRTKDWNPALKRLVFIQPKTGRLKSLPVTKIQYVIIQKAIQEKRDFILDGTNHDAEWRRAKKAAGLRHIQRRDLRRTSYTETVKTLGHSAYGQIIAGHASMRTGEEHYLAINALDITPAVKHLSQVFC